MRKIIFRKIGEFCFVKKNVWFSNDNEFNSLHQFTFVGPSYKSDRFTFLRKGNIEIFLVMQIFVLSFGLVIWQRRVVCYGCAESILCTLNAWQIISSALNMFNKSVNTRSNEECEKVDHSQSTNATWILWIFCCCCYWSQANGPERQGAMEIAWECKRDKKTLRLDRKESRTTNNNWTRARKNAFFFFLSNWNWCSLLSFRL